LNHVFTTGLKPLVVYPLAGKVTVDHELPAATSQRSVFVVVAYDASKPVAPAAGNAFVTARTDGSFEFPDGGLSPGKYVILFAELGYRKRAYYGNDALKNLYNDPEVNAKKPEFVIDHQAPGKTGYEFNLSVAGETPPAAPGPKALVGSQSGRCAGEVSQPNQRLEGLSDPPPENSAKFCFRTSLV